MHSSPAKVVSAACGIMLFVGTIAFAGRVVGASYDENGDGVSDSKVAAISSARDYRADLSDEEKQALQDAAEDRSEAAIAAWIDSHSSTASGLTTALLALKQYEGTGAPDGKVGQTIAQSGELADLIVAGTVATIGLNGVKVEVAIKPTQIVKGDSGSSSLITVSVRAVLSTNELNEVILVLTGGDPLPPMGGEVIYVLNSDGDRYFGQPLSGLYRVEDGFIVPPPGCPFADEATGLTASAFIDELS